MSAPKKLRTGDGVDPALIPFADALAELLVADYERNAPASVRRPRDATAKGNAVLGLAARAVERLESGANLTPTDRRRLVRLIRLLTRSYVDATTPRKRADRPAHRPPGQTPSARAAEVIAALVDHYRVSVAVAIRAVDAEAALDPVAYGKLHKAYQRYRARLDAGGVPFTELVDRPRRIAEWLERHGKK